MRLSSFVVLLSALWLAGCVPASGVDAPAAAVPSPAIALPTDPPPTPPAHLACAVDADCARVFRRCGSCECGAPLAREHVAAYAAEREARCRDVVAPQCEMDCPRTSPRCIQGRCGLVADEASSPR